MMEKKKCLTKVSVSDGLFSSSISHVNRRNNKNPIKTLFSYLGGISPLSGVIMMECAGQVNSNLNYNKHENTFNINTTLKSSSTSPSLLHINIIGPPCISTEDMLFQSSTKILNF